MGRALILLTLTLPFLSGCISLFGSPTQSEMYVERPAVDRPATVDPGAAVARVNEFRRSHGLGPVSLDPQLTAMAASQARAMAAANKMAHVLPGQGSFARRLAAANYDAAIAVENIGAGYHNLDQAFTGWKNSPHHRANMLKPGVTRMGIAVAYNGKSRFKDFWSMVLAAPDGPRTAEGPGAGPAVPFR
jgi:uncharacterized protein YkwD